MDVTLCLNSRDDELLAAVATGDRDAFAEIYDRFAPHVFARMSQQIADTVLAREAVAAVFLDFWRQAPRLNRSGADVTTWLFATPHPRAAAPAR